MSTPLKLYGAGTPNTHKIVILLEVLGLLYEFTEVAILKGEQKEEWFTKINPNGKLPTLVDELTGASIGQSGAIIQYLLDKYDTQHKISFPSGSKEQILSSEILFLEATELGAAGPKALFFAHWAPEKIPFAIDHFKTEVKRVYLVLEAYLERNKKNGYFVGDHYSAVDYVIAAWLPGLKPLGIQVEDYPLFAEWNKKISQLPEVQKGITVPHDFGRFFKS